MSKKGENIYKRKDGRWEARYIKGYAANGCARYGYCYAKSYREAREKVNAARAAMLGCMTGVQSERGKCLGIYCDEWLQLKRSAVKGSTYAKYFTIITKHIQPQLGGYPLRTLTPLLVEQFGYDLVHRDALCVKTAKDILTVLHAVLRYAQKRSPELQAIDAVYPKAEKKEMRVLSREEQERFMQYLLQDTDGCKFGTLLTLLTGLRIGEVCALRWKDISLNAATVFVRGTMQRIKSFADTDCAKTRVVISDPKSFSSARIIPLSPLAFKLCEQFYGDADAYILTGERERYIEPRTLQYRMAHYAAACGLTGVHFHTLRHSFATRCVEVGFEIKSLSEILGHASPQITLERYVHASMELKRENMNKLSAIGY